MINEFKIIQKYSSVKRFSQVHLVKPEYVSEHCGHVAMLVSFIISDIEKTFDALNIPRPGIDYRQLYEAAVYHDLDEIALGDVPRTTKHSNPETLEAFKMLERASVKIIIEDYGLDNKIYETWATSKAGLEGAILSLADTISVAYKLWEEISVFNNNSVRGVAEQFLTHLEGLEIKDITPYVTMESQAAVINDYFISYLEECCIFIRDVLE